MLLAMLESHYSTVDFVKWQDNSHLRLCAAAITHKDSHVVNRMLFVPTNTTQCACVYVAVNGFMCVLVLSSVATVK